MKSIQRTSRHYVAIFANHFHINSIQRVGAPFISTHFNSNHIYHFTSSALKSQHLLTIISIQMIGWQSKSYPHNSILSFHFISYHITSSQNDNMHFTSSLIIHISSKHFHASHRIALLAFHIHSMQTASPHFKVPQL